MRPFQNGIMTSATSQVAPLFHLLDLKKRFNGFSIEHPKSLKQFNTL
jgi:hypothetical protein